MKRRILKKVRKHQLKHPPKKGKEPDKPDLDVLQLEVPEVQETTSKNGYKYLVQRTTYKISN